MSTFISLIYKYNGKKLDLQAPEVMMCYILESLTKWLHSAIWSILHLYVYWSKGSPLECYITASIIYRQTLHYFLNVH